MGADRAGPDARDHRGAGVCRRRLGGRGPEDHVHEVVGGAVGRGGEGRAAVDVDASVGGHGQVPTRHRRREAQPESRIVTDWRVIRSNVGRAGLDRHRISERDALPARRRLVGEGRGGQALAADGPQGAGVRADVRGALVEPDPADRATDLRDEPDAQLDRVRIDHRRRCRNGGAEDGCITGVRRGARCAAENARQGERAGEQDQRGPRTPADGIRSIGAGHLFSNLVGLGLPSPHCIPQQRPPLNREQPRTNLNKM